MWDVIKIVIPKIKAWWKYVAYFMKYDTTTVKAIEKDSHNCKDACFHLFEDWLSTKNGITPKTWYTLINQIKDIPELENEAKRIKEEIITMYSKFKLI